MSSDASSRRRRMRPSTAVDARFDLGWFGVPLGLAGLGGVWSAAQLLLGAPPVVADGIYGIGAAFWLVLTARYVFGTHRVRGGFRLDLAHPGRGPATAFVPIIGLLLAGRLATVDPLAATALVWGLTGLLLVLAAALMQEWLSAGLPNDAVGPALLLPTAAGAFIVSIAFSSVGLRDEATGALLAGLFFWVLLGAPVLLRLMSGAALEPAQRPQLALLLAPPATAGIAWMLVAPTDEVVRGGFAAIVAFFLAVQLLLLRSYRRTPRSIGLWVFAFPVCSTSTFVVRWLARADLPVVQWSVVIVATAVIAAIAALSSPILRAPTRTAGPPAPGARSARPRVRSAG